VLSLFKEWVFAGPPKLNTAWTASSSDRLPIGAQALIRVPMSSKTKAVRWSSSPCESSHWEMRKSMATFSPERPGSSLLLFDQEMRRLGCLIALATLHASQNGFLGM